MLRGPHPLKDHALVQTVVACHSLEGATLATTLTKGLEMFIRDSEDPVSGFTFFHRF